jgi:N-acetylmuramic acid 6-phosphate etherase
VSATEAINQAYAGLDSWEDSAILETLAEGQERAIEAVRAALPDLAAAAAAIAERIGPRGRIIYTGAGSSGLIAALDGAELGGTFGWPAERVAFAIAGGPIMTPGMSNSGEDDRDRGRAEMLALKPRRDDVAIAVSASGATPYTLAAAEAARSAGALTIALANNPNAPLLATSDKSVLLDTGAEVIAGSTRLNAGTAQKAALALISTLAMIRLGHVYDGLMVDVRIDNAKLHRRALATLMHITGSKEGAAEAALALAGGKVKPAALILKGVAPGEADRMLERARGNLRAALAELE